MRQLRDILGILELIDVQKRSLLGIVLDTCNLHRLLKPFLLLSELPGALCSDVANRVAYTVLTEGDQSARFSPRSISVGDAKGLDQPQVQPKAAFEVSALVAHALREAVEAQPLECSTLTSSGASSG